MKPVQLKKKGGKRIKVQCCWEGEEGIALPSAAMSSCWNILRGVKPQAPGFLPRLPHGIPAREGMLWLGGGLALSEQTKSSLCGWGILWGEPSAQGWADPDLCGPLGPS